MNKNFKNIYENVGSNIQDTSSAMETLCKRFVNEVYFDALRRVNHQSINRDYSFTATTQDNVLPSDFSKELAVYDATNKITINKTSQENEIDGNVSSISSSGSISGYAILDLPVRVQPSSAATPSFVSSSASDNTQTLFVRGISDDVEVTETITLNGTTAVDAINSYSRYKAITKSSATVGKITGTHGSDTIVVMGQDDIDYRVKVMRLYAAPAQATVINVPYIIKPMPMSSDYDVPIIDIADIIELGATSRAFQYKRQGAKASDYKKLYEQGIINIIWDMENQPNDAHIFTIGQYTRDIS